MLIAAVTVHFTKPTRTRGKPVYTDTDVKRESRTSEKKIRRRRRNSIRFGKNSLMQSLCSFLAPVFVLFRRNPIMSDDDAVFIVVLVSAAAAAAVRSFNCNYKFLRGTCLIYLLPHACKVLFLALSVISFLFVCHSNISGTAERICAKFTGKTCLVPRWDEFEGQGQRSRSPGTKRARHSRQPPAATKWNALAADDVTQQRTAPFRRCRGVISAACVQCVFRKTSLALVFSFSFVGSKSPKSNEFLGRIAVLRT